MCILQFVHMVENREVPKGRRGRGLKLHRIRLAKCIKLFDNYLFFKFWYKMLIYLIPYLSQFDIFGQFMFNDLVGC